MAVLLLPNLSALSEPYGKLLIAKVVGFALLMGLAAANKWRLGPRPGPGIGAKWAMVSPLGGRRVCPDRRGTRDHGGDDVFLLTGGVTLGPL